MTIPIGNIIREIRSGSGLEISMWYKLQTCIYQTIQYSNKITSRTFFIKETRVSQELYLCGLCSLVKLHT